VKSFSLLPTLTTSQRLNYYFLPWNFWNRNFFKSITYVPNFKAKRLIQKKIFTIYQHVSFWKTIVETISLLPTLTPSPKGWKFSYLIWDFCHKILYILICVPNFKAKKVIQKKYSKSTNICSYENPFQYYQLWHLPQGWIFFSLSLILLHEPISILITCAPNFKVKRFIQKKICEFYQHVSLGEWFFTSMWNFTHKMTLSQGLKKSFSQQHMLVDFEYIFLNESFGYEIWHTCYQHRDGLVPKI